MWTTKLVLWLILLLRSGGGVFNVRCHQCSLNSRVHQDHLAGLLNDRLLGSTPRVSDSGVGPKNLNSIWLLHFENQLIREVFSCIAVRRAVDKTKK